MPADALAVFSDVSSVSTMTDRVEECDSMPTPETFVLAAIVLTGYLGGAVGTHLRIADMACAAIPIATTPARPSRAGRGASFCSPALRTPGTTPASIA